MRLFTAITFNETVKQNLNNTISLLKQSSTAGSFTPTDNLHITLVFIGETMEFETITDAMERAVRKAKGNPFELSLEGLGKFRRKEGDIYWIGVKKNEYLWRLQKYLRDELKECGFVLEDREYQPHVTLGRKIRIKKESNLTNLEGTFLTMTFDVSAISLMKSEHLQGKLSYTQVYEVRL